MLSKNKIKLLSSLRVKKYREEHRLFLIEGEKMCDELLKHNQSSSNPKFKVQEIYAVQEWVNEHQGQLNDIPYELVDLKDLKKISQLKTPNKVVASVHMPEVVIPYYDEELVLMLDGISDPGNLGTIIRTAEWFGFKHIICSSDSVDLYNPKVIQSTMGAIFTTDILYYDIVEAMNQLKKHHPLKPIFGATLEGENVYHINLTQNAILVMGNESKGIRAEIKSFLTREINIPRFGASESLNVASATAVLCSEFKRPH